MENSNKCSTVPNRPDFEVVLEKFNEELAKMEEFTNVTLDKVCKFKNVREPIEPDSKDGDNVGGVLYEFDVCISRMRKYNSILKEAKNGLSEIVG